MVGLPCRSHAKPGLAAAAASIVRRLLHALQALAQVSFGRSERAVRVNSIQSGLCEDDLRAVLTGEALPDALVVPKVSLVHVCVCVCVCV